MARYIDADKIVITELESNNKSKRFLDINNHCFITRNSKSIDTIISYVSKIIEDAPTEDVVPRSEVEKIFDKYGNYNFPTEPKESFNNTVVTGGYVIDWYKEAGLNAKRIMELEAELTKAKQEVAREIFEEIEKFIESDKGKVIYEADGSDWFAKETAKTFEISHNIGVIDAKNALRDLLDELKKKYIGE